MCVSRKSFSHRHILLCKQGREREREMRSDERKSQRVRCVPGMMEEGRKDIPGTMEEKIQRERERCIHVHHTRDDGRKNPEREREMYICASYQG